MSEAMFLKKWLNLPKNLHKEVEDFMDFLASKNSSLRKVNSQQEEPQKKQRTPGTMKGKIVLHDNFDDPIEGFEDYM